VKNNLLKKVTGKINHLGKSLTKRKLTQKLSPNTQNKFEKTDREITTSSNNPEEADEISLTSLEANLEKDRQFLVDALPTLLEYKISVFPSADDSSGATTTIVSEHITGVEDTGTPQAQTYSNRITRLYRDLKASKSDPNDVRRLLDKIGNQQTKDRFEEAYNSFQSYKSGVIDEQTSALLMRNFLASLQEDLFNLARKQPEENMTWEMMVARLVKATIGVEEDILLEQERIQNSLIRQLSDIIEDREGDSQTNLEYIWTQLSDHVYIVLSLTV
jgi:hypothetical protein